MKCFSNLNKSTVLLSVIVVFLSLSSCKKNIVDQPGTVQPTPVSDADLKALPKDLGGIHTPVFLNTTDNTSYGYYVYTPSGYQNNNSSYPLLIFLHGAGEIGNSMTTPGELKRLLAHGPPQLISQHLWAPTYPMIVVSPQSAILGFKPTELNAFITKIISKYRINIHRVYLTGISMGGLSTFHYLTTYPNGYVAAAVPMSAAFDKQADYSPLKNLPLWSFIGGDDAPLTNLIVTINTIVNFKPLIKPKLTVFPGLGHNIWGLVYSGSGMGLESQSYDAFNMSIYDWMFKYAK